MGRYRGGGLAIEALSFLFRLLAHSRPDSRIDSERSHSARCQVHEAAMIGAASVPEQPGQQGEHVIRNRAIDVRLLTVECFGGAARRQMIPFVPAPVND